jgi:hypothetical protein
LVRVDFRLLAACGASILVSAFGSSFGFGSSAFGGGFSVGGILGRSFNHLTSIFESVTVASGVFGGSFVLASAFFWLLLGAGCGARTHKDTDNFVTAAHQQHHT